jgi:hypothetical protein
LLPSTSPLKIYCDYDLLKERLESPFEAVTSLDDLSILWLSAPFQQWSDLPAGLFINQFPFEGSLVRKDLLLLTAKSIQASKIDVEEISESASVLSTIDSLFPRWCPVSFDLSTEAHIFQVYFMEKEKNQPKSAYICKLASGTRSSDSYISSNLVELLKYSLNPPDRIVQEYLIPMLILDKRKFDVRVYVAVKSFEPFQASIYTGYYARVANQPYADRDYRNKEQHFSVSIYSTGVMQVLNRSEIEDAAREVGVDWNGSIDLEIRKAIKELFSGAGKVFIGQHPFSRAIYGVDVMIGRSTRNQATETSLQVFLLEVNFASDLASQLTRTGPQEGFAMDAMLYLFSSSHDDVASSSEGPHFKDRKRFWSEL